MGENTKEPQQIIHESNRSNISGQNKNVGQ